MKVTGITCSTCKTFVYSRTRHDMRWCPCKGVFIDGGQIGDYVRTGGPALGTSVRSDVEIDTDPNALFKDWNTYANKLGWISPPECKHPTKDRAELSDGVTGCTACGARL